jgi:cephalosporin-C deacetylase-like acetyl esterase
VKKELFIAIIILFSCEWITSTYTIPDVGGKECFFDSDSDSIYDENLHLFDYNQQAPLNIQGVGSWHEGDATVSVITYASPKGGNVPATLMVPDGEGPFAGIVMMHGMPGTRHHLFWAGLFYADMGAVVILIDAPFARPENVTRSWPLTFTEQDREEQIQLIVDLRRAVDLLIARPDVDPDRIAYIGVSYGGAMGGLLSGVEDRLQAYVFVVGDGGLVEHVTSPGVQDPFYELTVKEQEVWVASMWPIEPIHYVGHAAPAALLFQNGFHDEAVLPLNAEHYQEAGSEPKTIMWYNAGHFLPDQHRLDQAQWLQHYIGGGDVCCLVANYRASVPVLDRLLLIWLLLTAGSLGFLIWDMWRTAIPWGIRPIWLLVVLFFGLLGLLVYLVSYRQPGRAVDLKTALTISKRALGSTVWSVAGNLVGGVLTFGIILAYPVLSDVLPLSLALLIFLSFITGLLIPRITGLTSSLDDRLTIVLRRPVLAEVISTNMVLVGAFPVVIILVNWWFPFGVYLTSPLLWSIFSLAAIIGALTAYPIHIWMIRRGFVEWRALSPAGESGVFEPESMKLSWLKGLGIILLTYAFLIAAIVLSLVLS